MPLLNKRHILVPFLAKIRRGGCLHSRKCLPFSAHVALGFPAECRTLQRPQLSGLLALRPSAGKMEPKLVKNFNENTVL